MKVNILRLLPPDVLRLLAEMRGLSPVKDESSEELGQRILDGYVEQISRTAHVKRRELIERGKGSVRRVRLALGLKVDPEQGAPGPAEEIIPRDPALRTVTLAEVYEKQGMVEEALTIYRELAGKNADDPIVRAALARLDPRHETPAPEAGDLPARYGVDEAALLMVRPDLLYSYWEVTPGTEQRTRGQCGEGGKLVLRLTRISVLGSHADEEILHEIDLAGTRGEKFIDGIPPDGIYKASIGLVSGSSFHPMVVTNAAATPSYGPSPRVDEEWMEVDQSPMAERALFSEPLRVTSLARLTAREIALLKLHSMGEASYSQMTGIDPERLRVTMRAAPGRVPFPEPFPGASERQGR